MELPWGTYRVEFKIDGTEYSFTKGYNDINGNPEGATDYTAGTPIYTFIAAVPSGSLDTEEYVYFYFLFSDSINEEDSWRESAIDFQTRIDGTVYNDDQTTADFAVVVLKIAVKSEGPLRPPARGCSKVAWA